MIPSYPHIVRALHETRLLGELCLRQRHPGKLAKIVVLLCITQLAGCNATTAPADSAAGSTPSADIGSVTPARSFLVIAHRGASGYRPEHTLAAYQLAIEQGADFIEPDLVPTRDGELVARHENALALVKLGPDGKIELDEQNQPTIVSATTDVAEHPEFSHLLTVRDIDGRPFAGWFSEDFTLAEIKTLYARERIPALRPDNLQYNSLRIPSLEEILELVQQPGNLGVGIYPELKHPTHFLFGQRTTGSSAINIDSAAILVKKLLAHGFTDPDRLYLQCFEVATLHRLKHSLLPTAGFDAPLVQLFGQLDWQLPDVQFHLRASQTESEPAAYLQSIYGSLTELIAQSPTYRGLSQNLAKIATDYASGIGPRKEDARALMATALAAGLEVHPYTVRADAYFLSTLRGALAESVVGELEILLNLGATGVFIDQPDLGVRWRSVTREGDPPPDGGAP